MYRITAQLTARRQLIKMQLYQRFSRVLLASLLAAIGFAGYQLYV
jgi:hypothetical protein